jgi:peptidyl-Lys metalloendopeptidase
MRRTFLVVATLLVIAAAGCADTQHGDLQVDLAMRDAAIADVTITNTSDHEVQLLSWYVPNTELQEPLFQVTRDGQAVRYIGPRYKRAQPDASDYVTLAPGASLSRSVDLATFYDLSATGNYTIELAIDDAKLRGQQGIITSSTVDAHISGRSPAKPQRPAKDTCTSIQHDQINAAFPIAGQYAADARDYLTAAPSPTQRYTTWFGAFSSAGWDTAHTHFDSIATAFATQQFTFDCSCKQKNVYAYVNPNQPYVITLCGAFWPAPTSGTDSKAGTLVHETSHFVTTASTNDWAYGKTACMSLAQSDPTKALDNADSHEYFAENTPAQP